MGMSVGGGGGDETPMSDINTTPLVDVMLVLLIIFLIAVPVVIQTVELELPVMPFEPTTTKRENVLLAVTTTDAAGRDPGDPEYAGANPGGQLPDILEHNADQFIGAGSKGSETSGRSY